VADQPTQTLDEFARSLAAAGLRLTAEQTASAYAGLVYLERMAERVRRERSVFAEPAPIFVAARR
jgi:hypothetical protein